MQQYFKKSPFAEPRWLAALGSGYQIAIFQPAARARITQHLFKLEDFEYSPGPASTIGAS